MGTGLLFPRGSFVTRRESVTAYLYSDMFLTTASIEAVPPGGDEGKQSRNNHYA